MEKEQGVTLTTGKKVIVKQVAYSDLLEIVIAAGEKGKNGSREWKKEYEIQLIMKASGLSREELDSLNGTDGHLIDMLANKLNAIDNDFLSPYVRKVRTTGQIDNQKQSDSTRAISSSEGSRGKK